MTQYQVWRGWAITDNATTNTTIGQDAATGESNSVWFSWCNNGTGTTYISSSGTEAQAATWRVWINASSDSVAVAAPASPELLAYQERLRAAEAERTARWEAERPMREAQERARQDEQAWANARAEDLLRASLTPEQLAGLMAQSAFVVRSERGRQYQIARGFAGNIYELDSAGRKIARYCIHPEERVPDPDAMLAQKLMLETDEQAFLRIANRTAMLPA